MNRSRTPASALVDSPYAWARLAAAVLLAATGGVGMWVTPVVLPAVQSEFAIARADASLPFTVSMLGFALGGVAMGRMQDRYGILAPALTGIAALALGFVGASFATGLPLFAACYLAIGVGASATFGPIMADVSFWFTTRRGIAVAIAAAGNYLAGTIWPPIVQHGVDVLGWRATHVAIALACTTIMLPTLAMFRQAAPREQPAAAVRAREATLNLSSGVLQVLLCIAGFACCMAMAMPQVHIVAYCGDLGYGVARGAEMLSIMLGCGIVSRVASGFVADRIGGLMTLIIGSVAQGTALFLYTMFDGLASLYVISALFGLFQGGIVPSYAFIIREYFPPAEAGTRIGIVLMMTLFGMAVGGWISGVLFDYFGSYQVAFVHGFAWNLLNFLIAAFLLTRRREGRPAFA
jgi:MFS family permease